MRSPQSGPIVFWSHRRRPSFTMRGVQIAERLRARGHDARFAVGPSWLVLSGLRGATVICVKSAPVGAERLRKRGNRVVLDAIDWQPGHTPLPEIDAILCASQHVRSLCERQHPKLPAHVVYHHADPGLGPHAAAPDRLRVAYIGEANNSRFISGQLPELELVDFKRRGWQARVRAFNAHFSARLDPHKSVVKLANCAAAAALFVGGPEPGATELLGTDYPFFFDPSAGVPEAAAALARLRGALGGTLWRDAAGRIAAAAAHLTLEAAAARYEAVLRLIARP